MLLAREREFKAVESDETVRDGCPVQEAAVARRLPVPAKGEPIAVDEPKVLPVERSRTVASDRPDHGPY